MKVRLLLYLYADKTYDRSEVRWVWNDYSLQSLLGNSMPICTQKTSRSPCIASCSTLFKPAFPTFTGAQTHFSWSTYYHAPELVVQETRGGKLAQPDTSPSSVGRGALWRLSTLAEASLSSPGA